MTQTQLQGRELDAALARALGCNVVQDGNRYRCECAGLPHGFDTQSNLYPYSTDLNAMHEIEAEIERRGLHGQYTATLFDLIDPTDGWIEEEKWSLTHATAEQRARAALAALTQS